MFHFWFNTFFVAADRDKHTVTMKPSLDGRTQSRSTGTSSVSTSVRQNYTAVLPIKPTPSTLGKPAPTTGKSTPVTTGKPSQTISASTSRLQQSQSRSLDKVVSVI